MSALAVGAAVGCLGMQAAKRLSNSSLNGDGERLGQNTNHINSKNVGILGIEVYTPSTYIKQFTSLCKPDPSNEYVRRCLSMQGCLLTRTWGIYQKWMVGGGCQ